MIKSNSPNHQPQLLRMLQEECHNSFLKLPNEAPTHIWKADKVEEHNQRMRKLDAKLTKYNKDIASLKEMLRQADEKHQVEMDCLEQREQEARQEVTDLVEASDSDTVEQEAVSREVQFVHLQACLEKNLHTIAELRRENKAVTRALQKKEKKMDQLQLNNTKLEQSHTSAMKSCSNLGYWGMDKIHDKNHDLCDSLEQSKEQFEKRKVKVRDMQEEYMEEAKQRLETQQKMAGMLLMIQDSTAIAPKVVKACTKIGLDVEARAKRLIEKIEEDGEWRDMYAGLSEHTRLTFDLY